MALEKYRKKRDFSKTPEPAGKAAKTRREWIFVVQKHDASRLHYDFRLELGGVLKSWAIPKGPSLDPADKRLAVEVEDHPFEYATFEGIIPAGQYGGGTVLVWDRGTWQAKGDPVRALARGTLDFSLEGDKLQGAWTLVRLRGDPSKDVRNWLLIKRGDEHARPKRDYDVTRDAPNSVATGRDLLTVAAERKRTWNSNKAPIDPPPRAGARASKPRTSADNGKAPATRVARATKRKAGPRALATAKRAKATTKRSKRQPTRVDPAAIEGAQRAPLLDWIEPELATLVRGAPVGEEWIHEAKFDGYRGLCHVSHGRVRWLTRNGNDWTERFKSLSPAVEALPLDEAMLDGEIVVVAHDGTTSFQELQNSFRGGKAELTYCAFDLLHLDGYDLRAAPLHARKAALQQLLSSSDDPLRLRYSDHIEGYGAKFLGAACGSGLEGIISKLRDSPYVSGRGRDWVKAKCTLQQEFVIGGFSAPGGTRQQFGALLLGYYDGDELHFAGKVGTGFDDRMLALVRRKLREFEIDEAPFVDPPRGFDARGVRYVRPKLVAAIQFTGWTGDGKLRHPSFQGLREDKPAREVVREKPAPTPRETQHAGRARRSPAPAQRRGTAQRREIAPRREMARKTAAVSRSTPKNNSNAEVAGVRISHPERVLYPDLAITKLDFARYYESVGDWILPHVADRPLNCLRCPGGPTKPCFFQRHGHDSFQAPVKAVDTGDEAHCIYVDSLAGLVTLAQMSVLEIHPWGSKIDQPDKPDRMFFDLDPDPSVPWNRVVETARLVRTLLEKLDLESFVKTTGGKGLHVVVPLARKRGWDEVKDFSHGVAEQLVRAAPDLYVAVASKAKRSGRVFIDYLRNARGASAVAAYSTRIKAGATVSTPITWDELGRAKNEQFDVRTVVARVKKLKKDPWAGISRSNQIISATAMRSVTGGGPTGRK